jgi:hypothetical protein
MTGFFDREGKIVKAGGNDLDHEVPGGSSVPVSDAAATPKDHVFAAACWFETY